MDLMNRSEYSYWELKQFFKQFDLIVVGSGIVGLSTAISFKEKNKSASVLVLERGFLPNGASTKNAGFACFGSAGELIQDLKHTNENVVWETIKMRWDGLSLLRKRIGDKHMRFELLGGFELFENKLDFTRCVDKLDELNTKIKSVLHLNECFKISKKKPEFKNTVGLLTNRFEGQLDTGLMMGALQLIAQKNGILFLNNVNVDKIIDLNHKTELQSNVGVFVASKVVVATNGFAKELLKVADVKPARAQVLITKPIKNLKIKGAFHFDEGFYYFRNIDNRILFGGGRNLDFESETTTKLQLNHLIQNELDRLLKEMILPNKDFKVEHRWSGIMGVGKEKIPIIKNVSANVVAAVRMGGMGVAIGSLVGKKTAALIH
jgi:gamma-glutamylputrescine oxidase